MWQERLTFLRDRQVPEAVLDRARAVEASLDGTGDRVREVRDRALLDLVKAFTLQARTVEASARVSARLEQVRSHRMELETASLWQLDRAPAQFGLVAVELGKAARTLREYLAEHGGRLAAAFFGILALSWWLFTRKPEQDLGPAQHAYGRPVAAATLIALVSSVWWAPAAPIVFYMLLLLLTPIPAAMLARRSFAAAIPWSLYGLAFTTVLLALRNAIEASPIADRILLLLQTLSLGVPVAIDLQRGRLQRAFARFSPGTVRLVALIVIAMSAATALHVFIGFSGPARSLRAGAGSVLGYGLVFGATALALYGVALALLCQAPAVLAAQCTCRRPGPVACAAPGAWRGGHRRCRDRHPGQPAAHGRDGFCGRLPVGLRIGGRRVFAACQVYCGRGRHRLGDAGFKCGDRVRARPRSLPPSRAAARPRLCHCHLHPLGHPHRRHAARPGGAGYRHDEAHAGGRRAERGHRLRAAARGQQFRLRADLDCRAARQRRRPGRRSGR